MTASRMGIAKGSGGKEINNGDLNKGKLHETEQGEKDDSTIEQHLHTTSEDGRAQAMVGCLILHFAI